MTLELDDALNAAGGFTGEDGWPPPEPVVETPLPCLHPKYERTHLEDGGWECQCGHVVTGRRARAGRNNRARGNRIQRQRIQALGGQNLAGNNPNLDGLGVMFRYESKSAKPGLPIRPGRKLRIPAFPEQLWAILRGIPAQAHQTRVLIVTEAPGPGRKARSFVVVEFEEWRQLHGETQPERSGR